MSLSVAQQTIPQQANISNQPKALRVVAEIISYIMHPVFFPVVMAFVIYKLTPTAFIAVPDRQVSMWILIIGFLCIFFPLFSIVLMKPLGFIGSFKMETARERTIPLMATMIFYFWVSHAFNSMVTVRPFIDPPFAFKVLLLGNFWGIILIFLANIFTKVSMHTATAGGMIGIIIVLMIVSPVNLVIPLFVAIMIAGIVGTARMILGAHQRGDIWLGYIIGIIVQLGAYLYTR